MVSDDAADTLFKRHTDLCNKLNLDLKAITESWESFQEISKNYTLEGDSLHWLGCAIFVACRNSITPTVGKSVIQGNCVNLTALLRHCNLGLNQFFCNIRKWADMVNLSDEFRKKIEFLEGTFAVTCNVFKEYCKIFPKIFKLPDLSDIESGKQRNRRQRSSVCTSSRLFEFFWNLYITIRGEYPTYSNDLVQSYHLLLVMCDLAFRNAFMAERKDLLNPQFSGIPSDWHNSNAQVPSEVPCIIDKIMDTPDMVDAKYIKQYHCKNMLSALFHNGTLLGNEVNFCGLLEPLVFDSNSKSLSKAYEAQLLSRGGFDERIFLAEYKRRIIEREQLNYGVGSYDSASGDGSASESPSAGDHQFGMVTPKVAETPLTGRRFLGPKEHDTSTLMTATQNIARLHALLSGRGPEPSEALLQIFQSCNSDPTEKVKNIIKNLGTKFVDSYTQNNQNEEQAEYARTRLQFATTLFYKLVESILNHEMTINKDISVLVQIDSFYECLLACSLQIVLHSYNSHKKFPWILTYLGVQACHFLKVIELVVRSKDNFNRDTIKHLNMIEEMILESLVWKSNSILWNMLTTSDGDIPTFEETALPGHLLYDETENADNTQKPDSETTPRRSPGPSAADNFQSPISGVSRQLFPTSQGGQSLLQKHTHLMLTDADGNKRLIPIMESEAKAPKEQPTSDSPSNPPTTPVKPKRTGSLSIIFRKFYNLAGVRMEHLCTRLNITDVELKRKIWTVFEHSVRKHTGLLRDRHLDQLLMCAVYVICKVSGNPQNFADIMKSYREQPQCDSHIYRSVLIKPKEIRSGEAGEVEEVPEKRGDLIEFYNSVYISLMKSFAVKFSNNLLQGSDILLSPLPAPKKNLVSPSVQVVKNIFIKPMDSPTVQATSGKSYNYYFSRSPSKDLKDINRAINSNGITGKRNLTEGVTEVPSSKRIATRKVQNLLEERRNQNTE